MTRFSMSSLDEANDYLCSFCVRKVGADFYCETCLKLLCGQCIHFHYIFYDKHVIYGRDTMKKWPVSKQMEEFLLKCESPHNENIELFCDDHSELCCKKCAFYNHRHCSKVTPISEMAYTQPTDLQGFSWEVETVLEEIKSLQGYQEASVQSLQGAYNEHEGSTIEQVRQNINSTISASPERSQDTSNEQEIKEEMCRGIFSFLDDFDKITVKKLKDMKDEVKSIKWSITSSIKKFTGLQNKLTKLYDAIQQIGKNNSLGLIASIKCEHTIQQALTMLGKSGNVFTVQGKDEHNIKIPSDSETCFMTGCCVLPDGQALVVDCMNKSVKLLDQQYQVVSHCRVTSKPWDIHQITPSEVAVTVDDNKNTHEVQFITVTMGQLVPGRKFQLQYSCRGIAHHHGDLFITSGTALYKYSLSGKFVCRLYEAPDAWTVWRCAVSPTGDKLYVTSFHYNILLIIARDGTPLATFTNAELHRPTGVHVTSAGQVLVCGYWSHSIVQVDSEGRKLATLVTRDCGVCHPESVCYNSATSSIIVGQNQDNILVFKVE